MRRYLRRRKAIHSSSKSFFIISKMKAGFTDAAGQFRSKLQIGELDAPRSVRLVVARRIARLGRLTREMLAAASVIGRFFSFEVLQVLYDDDADSILECLEEAEKAGLLVSVATGSQARFAFSHELIRQAVLGGLSAMRRQRLHLKVADAIEQMASMSKPTYATSLDELAAQLAHHHARGGNPGKAVAYYLSAVQQLADLGSNVEAIAMFNAALELLSEATRRRPADKAGDRPSIRRPRTIGRQQRAGIGGNREFDRPRARAMQEAEDQLGKNLVGVVQRVLGSPSPSRYPQGARYRC